jgi:hypothetical protein
MTQTRRACLFCGETAKASSEHIVPKWIGRLFREQVGPGHKVSFTHRWELPELGIPSKGKSAKLPAFLTRTFCEGCNTGWMAELEEKVGPVLGPLILGKPARLSVDQQQLLAFWATKTVLAFQSTEHELTTWARPVDYATVFAKRVPLECAQIWLGHTNQRPAVHYLAHRYPISGPGPRSNEVHGFGATITFGHAVFYMLLGYAGPVGMRMRYDAAVALKEIWPNRRGELDSPVPASLSEAEIMTLAKFAEGSSVIASPPNESR